MKRTGSCHCGKVKFEAEVKLAEALECNCSICIRRGSLLEFVPETQFKLLSGEENLTEYLFNKKKIHHTFCKTCGILPFAKSSMPDGTKIRAINIRCIDDVDLSQIKINHYDGKHV